MKKLMLTAVASAALALGAKAATTYTWTGDGDGTSWDNAANWGGENYPQDVANDTAKFTSSVTLTTGSDIAAKRMVIGKNLNVFLDLPTTKAFSLAPSVNIKSEGATLDVGSGSTLTISGGEAISIKANSQTYNQALSLNSGSTIVVTNGASVKNEAPVYGSGGTILVTSGSTWTNAKNLSGSASLKNTTVKAVGLNALVSSTSGLTQGDGNSYIAENGGKVDFSTGGYTGTHKAYIGAFGENSQVIVSITKNKNAGPNANGTQIVAADGGLVKVGATSSNASYIAGFLNGMDNNGVLVAVTNGTVNLGTLSGVNTGFGTATSDPATLLGNPTLRMVGANPVITSSTAFTIGAAADGLAQYPIVEFVLGENGFASAPLTSSKELTIQSNAKLVVDASALLPQEEDGSLAPVVLAQPSGTLSVAEEVLANAEITPPEGWAGVLSVEGKQLILSFLPAGVAIVPTVPSKVYTGETLVAEPEGGLGWKIAEDGNLGGEDVGDYTVTLTFAEGYSQWEGGSTEPTDLTFKITQASNEWTVEPSISKATWLTSDDPGELTPGETAFGTPTATIAKDGGDAIGFDGKLPRDAGRYVITYAVEESRNWTNPDVLTRSVEFEIVADDVVPPFVVMVDAISSTQRDGQVDAMFPYAVTCEVASSRTVDLYALYALEGADKTNEYKFAEGVALDARETGVISDIIPGTNYYVSVYGKGGETVSSTTAVQKVTVAGPATGLCAAATFTNDPKEFVISGSVTPGLGTTTVYLRWSLNSNALDHLETFEFAYGDEGVFSKRIAYVGPADALTWDVAASNAFATAGYGNFVWSDAQESQTSTRADTKETTYTWTAANVIGQWSDGANWKSSSPDCYGFPNSLSCATAVFDADVVSASVVLTEDVEVHELRFLDNVTAMTLDLSSNAMTCASNYKKPSATTFYGSTYLGAGVLATIANGMQSFGTGSYWIQGGDSELILSNMTMTTGSNGIGTGRAFNVATVNDGSVKNVKICLRDGSNVTGQDAYFKTVAGGVNVFIESGSTLKLKQPNTAFSAGSGVKWHVSGGSKLILGESNHFSISGDGTVIVAEGEDSSVTVTQIDHDTHDGISAKNATWAAVDGATFTFTSGGKAFKSNGSADVGNRFVASNGTIKVTRIFDFGCHTTDETCVSPTIALAGTNATFKTEKAFVFGTDAVLAKPPMFELNPAANGLKNPCITSGADSITIGSNVCVKVITSGILASGGAKAKVTLARVKASGTLAVDVNALAANTTVVDGAGEPDKHFSVRYSLNDVTVGDVAYKDLVVTISRGGFAVILR